MENKQNLILALQEKLIKEADLSTFESKLICKQLDVLGSHNPHPNMNQNKKDASA